MESILDIWETAPSGEQMQKALDAAKEEQRKAAEPKSAIIDPANTYGVSGTRSKQSIVPFQMLRSMAKIPAVAAILLTRKNQVARFARRPRFDGDLGFRVGLKDSTAKMTEEQERRAHEIEEFFLRTGSVRNKRRKDDFDAFLRKVVDDTLTLDAMTWEHVPNLGGGLAELWAVDAATIELVINAPTSDEFELPVYEPMTKRGREADGLGSSSQDGIAYVQRINGQIVAEYTEDELAYAIRNPRTDINTVDFGTSELEILIEIVTAILNGTRYNTTYFTHSYLPQGVLEMVGKYQQADLDNFKRHWKQLTSGASGKWAVPVMALQEGQGFKFTPFKNSNKDMEFSQFMEFLFNIACAVYQIDPNEVGFKSWTSGSGVYKSDNTSEKMASSLDKGFVPLMNFLSNKFNSEVIDLIDPDYAFYWVGVDEEDEDRKLERQKTQVDMGAKTIYMLWEENGVNIDDIKKVNGGEVPKWAHAPANATLMQVYMAEMNQAMEAEQAEQQAAQQEEEPSEAEQAQAQADDGHAKGMEKMEAEQEHELEKLKLQHEQNVELEKVKAQSKPTPTKADKGNLKKSMEPSEDEGLNIVISWDEY